MIIRMLAALRYLFRSLGFLIGEALVNLRRHGLMTIAAVTTIAVTLALLGTFGLTFYQMNVATDRAAGDFEIHVYLREQVSKRQVKTVDQRLHRLTGIRSIEYISKEQAYNNSSRDLPVDMTGVPNLFNETFVLRLNDTGKGVGIARTIRGWHAYVQEVRLPESEMQGVLRIVSFLRTVGTIGGAVLLFGALLVVSNTIRISLFARRREIKIMQIVGAAPWFIRLPLVLEGLIHGALGGLVAAFTLLVIDRAIHNLIREVIPMMSRYFTQVDMAFFGVAVVVTGALIGTGGSILSIRRYLRVL